MPNLTTKELTALSDQLDFERVLHCKYLSAVQESQDQELKTRFQSWYKSGSPYFEEPVPLDTSLFPGPVETSRSVSGGSDEKCSENRLGGIG